MGRKTTNSDQLHGVLDMLVLRVLSDGPLPESAPLWRSSPWRLRDALARQFFSSPVAEMGHQP